MFGSDQRRVSHCHNIADLRRVAKRRLPRPMFDYMDGAAEDEVALGNNSDVFGDWQLVPRVLRDVAEVDMAAEIMGQPSALPVVLAPTGMNTLFHHRGELAVAAAAREAGLIYSLSSMSSFDIETVGAATDGPKWFQIYVWKDRAVVKEFIQRCRDAGYKALCLTVDVPVFGRRERDLRNGMVIPPRFTPGSLLDIALHPHWWWHVITSPPMTLANVAGKAGQGLNDVTTLTGYAVDQFDSSVTWDDLAWMIEEWGGPFAVKGVARAADAVRAVEAGATGIIISNHGGRQLDQSPAPLEVLPEIVEAVAGRAEVILDGGVRRGSDVIKALALGAKACMIGRGYLYGLGAGGQAGVERALSLLRDEISRTLALIGCASVRDLNGGCLRRRRGV
jgi:L-lactate dehydrogenase (cytochrome)